MKDSKRFKAKYKELLNNEANFDRAEALTLIEEMLLEVIRLEYVEDENSYTPPEFRDEEEEDDPLLNEILFRLTEKYYTH